MNELFDKIYLLNLKKDTTRLEKTTKLLNNHNIKYTIFEAIDGLTKETEFANLKTHKINSLGAYGCLLSHIEIYKDALTNNYNRILILEDDILIHKDIHNLFKTLKIPDWNLLYFGSSQRLGTWNNIEFINKNIYKAYMSRGTFAYAIAKDILPKLINLPHNQPIDLLLNDIPKKYVIYPNLIISDVSTSNTQNSRDMNQFAKIMRWNLTEYDFVL
jgi:GR25 family glycosyltransferase involved in LPS biosynthesis